MKFYWMIKVSKTIMVAIIMVTSLFAAKPTIENVVFRDGVDKFPVVGKGRITLTSGTTIKGEFRQGMLIKMSKWQWYDTKGKLHKLKEGDVQRIELIWDKEVKKATEGPDIEININLGVGPKIEPKNLPYNIKQFKDFDQANYYEPIILERVNGKLMVQVNNDFDSKLKVFVPLGIQPKEYGYEMQVTDIVFDLIFGGGQCGKKYSKLWIKKGDDVVFVKKPGILNKLLFGKFSKKEFVTLFGDNEAFMSIYPKPGKRKFNLMPEYIWVYNQK